MRRRDADDDARAMLRRFLSADSEDRLFRQPTCHPAYPTGFCACDRSVFRMLCLYLRGAVMTGVLMLPLNGPKIRLLRGLGAVIGQNVYLSVGVWIDPTFPSLIQIEDGVFIGMGARLFTHEFRRDEFRAGRCILRKGAFVGAFAVIACGTEVGENASVAACTALARDVPPRATALGNPARIVLDAEGDSTE
jgi:hypothetical protein